jgi:hypothetical protein
MWKGSVGVHDAGGAPKKAHVPYAPGAGVRGSTQRQAHPSATHPVPSRAAVPAASTPGRRLRPRSVDECSPRAASAVRRLRAGPVRPAWPAGAAWEAPVRIKLSFRERLSN